MISCLSFPPSIGRRSEGFALISVLWLVILLTVIAGGLSYTSRQSTQSMSVLIGGIQARYLADGAAQLVMMNLLSRSATDRLLADGETIEVALLDGHALITVRDENGKIDINAAKSALLARLLYSLDVEQLQADAIADAIADYRDKDELKRLNGAESADYFAAGLTWGAKDSVFTSVEELQRVYGMQPEIYRAMLPYVTIYTRHKGVNPEVAPLKVLMAISDDPVPTLENYIEQRRDNHQNGLPLPSAPTIARELLSHTRGITYSLMAIGVTESEQQSGLSTTIRLIRGRNRLSIETIDWQPYINKMVEPDQQSDTLQDK
jgi:general secretion pathway protein K